MRYAVVCWHLPKDEKKKFIRKSDEKWLYLDQRGEKKCERTKKKSHKLEIGLLLLNGTHSVRTTLDHLVLDFSVVMDRNKRFESLTNIDADKRHHNQ